MVDVHRDYLSVHEVPRRPKVQCAVFFLEDRGTAWWETAERMLGGDVSKITWEQFKENFYAEFFSANVKHAKLHDRGVVRRRVRHAIPFRSRCGKR